MVIFSLVYILIIGYISINNRTQQPTKGTTQAGRAGRKAEGMNYTEFKKTYKNLIKKYYEITNLFNVEGLTLVKTEYVKIGSRWAEVKKTESKADFIIYCNIFDSVYFFRNLGGYERTKASYTRYGFIPSEQISINPDRTRKSVYNFYFDKCEK